MFEKKPQKKKSKVVGQQSDGSKVYGFDDEKVVHNSEEAKAKMEQDYSNHPKFAKFKGEEK